MSFYLCVLVVLSVIVSGCASNQSQPPKPPKVKRQAPAVYSDPTIPEWKTNVVWFRYPPGFSGTNYAIESTTNFSTWQFERWSNGEKSPLVIVDKTKPKKFFRVRLP